MKVLPLCLAACLLAVAPEARSADNIIKRFHGIRSVGMGGALLTTGLYDENFFGNPARVTQNPKPRFHILDASAETTASTLSTLPQMLSAGNQALAQAANSAGSNNHIRAQTTWPSYYHPGEKLSWAAGLITSTQSDINLRRSYLIDPLTIVDLGAALTVGHKFLEDHSLSVGLTTHFTYRLSSKSGFTLVDLLKGASLSPLQNGGEGGLFDIDLGATYMIPQWKPLEFDLTVGAALNNILGGARIPMNFAGTQQAVLGYNRSFGIGIAATRPTLWKFTNAVFALEFNDIGNNGAGNFFRLFHLGSEVRYGVMAIRLGFNQGYFGAGLGLDTKYFQLDLATYGEEMSLIAGHLEDRRFSARIGFSI